MWSEQDLNFSPVSRLPDDSQLFRLSSVSVSLTSVREQWGKVVPRRPINDTSAQFRFAFVSEDASNKVA
jgi:hypothetical protein